MPSYIACIFVAYAYGTAKVSIVHEKPYLALNQDTSYDRLVYRLVHFLPISMTTVGSYEAKTHLPALLDRVERGESVIITRRGRPAARLVPIEDKKADIKTAIAELKAFGKKHRNRLRGISFRELIEHGRRY